MSKNGHTSYNPDTIEPKWQKYWEENNTYSTDMDAAKRPFYNLMMFPYPSAEGLHVGNMYAQTGSDIYGRFMRMKGFNVFEPIGLDGYGIHSENYALKVGRHPIEQAEKSEKNFYRQMHATGSGFDWKRTLETYDPDYYKWTQWLFIQMFKHGLAYRKKAQVNWCPSCKTVLSDEQVISGECERCGSTVEKRNLEQWFFRITDYAGRLIDNLESIDWSERVKIAQKNWIGRSEGARVRFLVRNKNEKTVSEMTSKNASKSVDGSENDQSYIEVFTTRPDTLFGATFMVVSPEHPIVNRILNLEYDIDNKLVHSVKKYVEQASRKTERERLEEGKEKTGVFSGLYTVNPVNDEEIQVWIADYVLMGYGTGAIMAVPAHDQRDFQFAKKYDLPVRHVVMPSLVDQGNPPRADKENTKRKGVLAVVYDPEAKQYLVLDWKKQGWKTFVTGGLEEGEDSIEAAMREITEETGYKDLELIRRLGSPVEAFFYAAHKGVNRQVYSEILLFELKSRRQQTVSEQEQELHNVMWMSEEELRSVGLRHAELELILEWVTKGTDVYTGDGVLINSGDWNGLKVPEEFGRVLASLEESGTGQRETTYHLRDWLISRQRYWGPPIPMIYCESCAKTGKSWFTSKEAQEVQTTAHEIPGQPTRHARQLDEAAGWYPDEKLPVELPYIEDFKPVGTGKAPLANHPEFYNVTCPECGSPARRETDVSDTFLDSAWYFLRYPSTDIDSTAFDIDRTKKWLPVNIYIGGAEHSVLHLLYARFVTMALHDMGLLSFEEPFTRFYAHGLLIKEGAKMSKSKGNVINPDEYISKYGADTLRLYLMFLGPFSQGGDFYDTGIEGMSRFVKRVWNLITQSENSKVEMQNASERLHMMHKTIKKVTEDMDSFSYNTAIAAMMEYYNYLSAELQVKNSKLSYEEAEVFLKLLAPFAPHFTEELYHVVLQKPENESIHHSQWPEYDQQYLVTENVTIVIQINGKRRGQIDVSSGDVANQQVVQDAAQNIVARYTKLENIRKIIYIPGRIINYVV